MAGVSTGHCTGLDLGAGVPPWDWAGWVDDLGVDVTVHLGFDADTERASVIDATVTGHALLSIRLFADEVLIGPLWVDAGSACAGCAEARDHHQYAAEIRPPTAPSRTDYPPLVDGILQVLLTTGGLADGALVAISANGSVRRHHVRRSQHCTVCAPWVDPINPDEPPAPVSLRTQPANSPLAVRGESAPFDLDLDRLRAATADPRFGPVTRTRRNGLMSFALSQVLMLGDSPPGQGRGATFGEAEVIGYLEGFERSAGYPHTAPLLRGAARRELGDRAIDPAQLGTYSEQQYTSPLSRVHRFDEDTTMDWAWARPLDGGPPTLVPADIAFYSHHYPQLPTPESKARNYFLESSSGSALGGSFEEAALHSLLELAERDAFLLSWHGAQALVEITTQSIEDRQSRLLLRRIHDAGYDVHLLRATHDIELPVVWALLIGREPGRPASFSAAGSNPDPRLAVRAALWEVGQCALAGATWDDAEIERLAADPWQVDELHDHITRNASPQLLPRVTRSLGGPKVSLQDAFPGWPEVFVGAAGRDVTQALQFVVALFRAAGLDTILTVDQSSREHRELGLSVVRCVVPGIVPMCFGQAQQRLGNLPRLDAVLGDAAPLDPHPFP